MRRWHPVRFAPLAVPATMLASWPTLTPWGQFWCGLFGLFLVAKWASWQFANVRAPVGRQLGYLFTWPGMNAEQFLDATRTVARPRPREWLEPALKIGLGFTLVYLVAPLAAARDAAPLLVAWIGLIGIGFVVFLGLFHLSSIVWRTLGRDAPIQWHWPILASSPSDFWSRRWNRAFRRLAYDLVFRRTAPRLGAGVSMGLVFLISGVVHELVVSAPANAGWGLPTLYFLLQAVTIAVEKSALGHVLGLRHRPMGWIVGFATIALAGGLLFHPPFMKTVILPGLRGIGASV